MCVARVLCARGDDDDHVRDRVHGRGGAPSPLPACEDRGMQNVHKYVCVQHLAIHLNRHTHVRPPPLAM